jgi:rubrerythrin
MSLPAGQLLVLGLRFYACSQCNTVHAEPMAPAACPTCDAGEPQEITDRLQTDPYFFTQSKK